jgi:hypothetical protein
MRRMNRIVETFLLIGYVMCKVRVLQKAPPDRWAFCMQGITLIIFTDEPLVITVVMIVIISIIVVAMTSVVAVIIASLWIR